MWGEDPGVSRFGVLLSTAAERVPCRKAISSPVQPTPPPSPAHLRLVPRPAVNFYRCQNTLNQVLDSSSSLLSSRKFHCQPWFPNPSAAPRSLATHSPLVCAADTKEEDILGRGRRGAECCCAMETPHSQTVKAPLLFIARESQTGGEAQLVAVGRVLRARVDRQAPCHASKVTSPHPEWPMLGA